MTSKHLYHILSNPKYTGKVKYGGQVYTNIIPPLITEELWRKVNDIHQTNKHAPGRKKDIFDFLLSGNVICANGQHKILKAAELNVDQSRNPISDYGFPINLFFIINFTINICFYLQ